MTITLPETFKIAITDTALLKVTGETITGGAKIAIIATGQITTGRTVAGGIKPGMKFPRGSAMKMQSADVEWTKYVTIEEKDPKIIKDHPTE
jgi:hypothetical protein